MEESRLQVFSVCRNDYQSWKDGDKKMSAVTESQTFVDLLDDEAENQPMALREEIRRLNDGRYLMKRQYEGRTDD